MDFKSFGVVFLFILVVSFGLPIVYSAIVPHNPKKTQWVVPVKNGVLTSRYGLRINPITNQSEYHTGIDIAAPSGVHVVAVRDGKVNLVGRDETAGIFVEIEHPDGMYTFYGHLSKSAFWVRRGSAVSTGQLIGFVGSTGQSTGPHLHFQMYLGKELVDPMKYIGSNN